MKSNDLVLVLDNIRSLHNVGAIFRTADGLGVNHIYLCGITATPPRTEIHKTALGAETHVQWSYYKSTLNCLHDLRKVGYAIVALEITPTSTPLQSYKPSFPLALIFGHETSGVAPNILDDAETHVYIPMLGHASSLNVATAAGIACWHAKQQIKNGVVS